MKIFVIEPIRYWVSVVACAPDTASATPTASVHVGLAILEDGRAHARQAALVLPAPQDARELVA